jgi:membrane associated rhomboid family serine protease
MIPTLGASGAIAGMMGAYLIWFPHNRVRVLLFRFITEVPALIVIGLWILGQLWAGIGSFGSIGEEGGVAYLAHIGGAAAGIAMAFVFRNRAQAHSNLITEVGWSGEHRRIRPGRPY